MAWSRRVGTLVAISATALVALACPTSVLATPVAVIRHSPVVQQTPPPGALAAAFANSQLTYCSLICPHIIDFVADVPVAIVRTPAVFGDARARTHSVDRSIGVAMASVTDPANSAMSGIIGNDLDLVLPRAQNALEVAVVEMLRVSDAARSGAAPGALRRTVETGRSRILDALDAPIVVDPPQLATPTTPAQTAALDAIDVGSAVLFRAPEMLMVGATIAADAAADELAATGDITRARDAGATDFSTVVDQASSVINSALTNHHRPLPARPSTVSKYSPTGSGSGTLGEK